MTASPIKYPYRGSSDGRLMRIAGLELGRTVPEFAEATGHRAATIQCVDDRRRTSHPVELLDGHVDTAR
jgi:hypothetical protein